MNLTLGEIAEAIQANGRAAVHVQLFQSGAMHWASSETGGDVASRLVQGLGFEAINPRSWSQLNGPSAESVAERLLSEDLAYKSELFSPKTARYYAGRLIATLSRYEAKFFCNATFFESGFGFDPIGAGTFEAALVGFDGEAGFLLYAQAID